MSTVLRGFHGGVRLPRSKETLQGTGSRSVALPPLLIYPLQAHVGTPARPVVGVGQKVRRDELLAAPSSYVSQAIHAGTSGVIVEIAARAVIHPGGVTDTCIVLRADGEDRRLTPAPALDLGRATPEGLLARIAEAGIVGMGGAGFPSHVKLREGLLNAVRLLIINAVECEPYIACDECMIRERAADVLLGARILRQALRASQCVIALEDDMQQARAALSRRDLAGAQIVRVPAIYPAGGERQLIRMITGAEVPAHGLPIDAGVVMHNAATAAAVADAVAGGLPLTERLVTVAGAVRTPANLRVRIGTPIAHLLDACGRSAADARVIVGGPMMGTRLIDEPAPVVKTTNCVLRLPAAAEDCTMPCIRCGDCVEVCPAQLQPQALYELARAGDWDGASDLHLFDCIECGACAYVCPSRLPLVHYYRHAKSEIEALELAQRRAAELRSRYEARLRRLAQAGDAAAEAEGQAGSDVDAAPAPAAVPDRAAMRAEIAAAVARTKARRTANTPAAAGEDEDGAR
ncbi:MAG: Electron transport complex subunit RsxC [Gammaproteobacteria bacterium]|nr:Electron transport complex subunit RsxC [Gammaproteobacteria bacterium]